jgi:glycosyltransferase involved in cell wall biosynthesis
MSPSVLARRMAHADLVVTCSDFVGRASEALVPGLAGRWTTVHNGVDAAAAARPGRRPGPPYLLYVGALSPHKGVHDAVAAFAQLAPRFPDLELHLVGPDGLYPPEEAFPLGVPGGGVPPELVPLYRADYAERLTEGLPSEVARRVRRVGWLDDRQLAETFAGAEAFVFTPVWDEGFGLPALEAMAAGTPAVVTRSGGLPEVVADGVTGAVVDKSDPGAVARAVEALLTDPERRRRSSEAARARAATFDWAVAAPRLEAANEGAREAGRAESRLVG